MPDTETATFEELKSEKVEFDLLDLPEYLY